MPLPSLGVVGVFWQRGVVRRDRLRRLQVGSDCLLSSIPIKNALSFADRPGKVSLDIVFVDVRGVVTSSQRHRIQRDSCANACQLQPPLRHISVGKYSCAALLVLMSP